MELSGMRLEYDHNILPRNSVLMFSLFFIMSLFFLSVYLSTEIYGSTGSTDSCESLANLTNCLETSSASNTGTLSKSEPKSAEIPLILPDISSTDADLNDIERDGNVKATDTEDTDIAENRDSPVDNRDADGESGKEAGDSVGGESGNEPSLLPFP
jgi:hypothetical protein